VFYHKASSGKFVSRTVFFDLEPDVIDAARELPLGELFRLSTILWWSLAIFFARAYGLRGCPG
jgi:hypothetical protein